MIKPNIILTMGNSKSKPSASRSVSRSVSRSHSTDDNPFDDPPRYSVASNNQRIYKNIEDLPTYDEIYGDDTTEINNKITKVFAKHDINQKHWEKLMILKKFDIYVIGDDSGSMQTPVEGGKTRWDELLQMLKVTVDIASVLDDDGITVSLLNAGTVQGVRSVNDERYKRLISRGPNGGTPLAKALKTAISSQKQKPMLIIIATDGEPSDGQEKFTQTIFSRDGSKVFISILACTDDDKAVGYLNGIDKDDATLDVLDDYRSERAEILAAQGEDYQYTLSDHFVRCMLGPIHSKYDKLDEYKVSSED